MWQWIRLQGSGTFFALRETMEYKVKRNNFWVGIPSWLIIGSVLILTPIFIFLTLHSINRQKENTISLLKEKGAALIRSFEAGARTGMMGMRWGGAQVQRLLSETAGQKDISFILVTDADGKILADSDLAAIGKRYGAGLDLQKMAQSEQIHWREVETGTGKKVFEVFRRFQPIRGRAGPHGRSKTSLDWCRRHMVSGPLNPSESQVIFVGLDMDALEVAEKEDIQHTIIMGIILLLIGFAGIVSLFLVQAYRSAKMSFSRVKAFSDHLVQHMPLGLVAMDSTGQVVALNQSAETLLGVKFEDAVTKAAETTLPRPLIRFLKDVKTSANPVIRELALSGSAGKELSFEVIGTTLFQEDSGLPVSVILFRDLTELKNLKEEVARSERLASIGRLAAGVAHEIRNPLSSIKGFATYFRERYQDVPEDRQTADIMIQEVQRMNRVVGQLLEFARPVTVEKKVISLSVLVRRSLKMIEGDAKVKKISLEMKTDDENLSVQVDPDSIQQVLLNLYLNSLEAMDNGGRLTVLCGLNETGTGVEIKVTDTGSGISEENLSNLFDPYFTTRPSGTGLGLAIVHKIIESHQGEVVVESRVGEGTSVTITLPVSREAFSSGTL